MNAYPNPFTDLITIESEKKVEGQNYLYIFDMAGKRISKLPFDKSIYRNIDLSHLDTGSYLVVLDSITEIDQVKIIKE